MQTQTSRAQSPINTMTSLPSLPYACPANVSIWLRNAPGLSAQLYKSYSCISLEHANYLLESNSIRIDMSTFVNRCLQAFSEKARCMVFTVPMQKTGEEVIVVVNF